jgi:glucokinase
VVRLAKRYLAAHEIESTLRRENLTCKDVFAGAEAGDPAALAVTEQVYDYLGRLMASIACVTDPEIFVIGGGVSRAGKPLLEGAARYFKKYAFHASRETPIAAATLGNDAGVYGAFQLII